MNFNYLKCFALCSAAFVLGTSLSANAQNRQQVPIVRGAMSIESKPVQVLEVNLKTLRKARFWRQGEAIKEVNPRQSYGRESRVREILKSRVPEVKIDSLLGFRTRTFENQFALAKVIDLKLGKINIDGQAFSGVTPPDVCGDVGPNHYIQAINHPDGTAYTIYKKADGSVDAGPFILTELAGQDASGEGDPIVLYDHLANRWLLSEFTEKPVNAVHVYISKTADPITGGWFHYRFDTPNFPDYPKYGVWPNGYYMTSNEKDGPAIYAFDRSKMLTGQVATLQRFVATQLRGFGFQALTPVDLDGPTTPPDGSPFYAMRHRDDEVHNVGSNNPNEDYLELFELRIDWTNSANSTMTGPANLAIAEFDSDLNGLDGMSCFPQKGSNILLDPLREVIMHRLAYRNFGTYETILGSFVTDVDGKDHGGIRWFELRKAPSASWVVHQEGTYAPDSHSRWMSSIAMDGDGNIGVGYCVSSPTMFPSLRVAGRLASDPMGTLPRGELKLIEGTAANSNNRYGDYATLSIDPTDDHLFWFTGEFNAAKTWSTRIGTFSFAK